MIKQFYTYSAEQTMQLGERLASALPNGITIALTGDLGAGKTTLVRGIAQGLMIEDIVQSPTFNIMKIYFKGKKPLIHIDAYRLENVATDIGLEEYIGYETGITVIEWPQYIENLIPENALEIEILNQGNDTRSFSFKGPKSLLGDLKI